MAISNHIIDLTALALQDRVLTFKERQTIVDAALKEGVSANEINAYIDNALNIRLKSYTKEELGSCPGCGHGVPLIADDCPYCGRTLEHQESAQQVPPPYRISGEEANIVADKDADIIRSENTRIAEEKKKNCPKCGAAYPLVSNICPNCQYVLHERTDSDLNIKNLIANINESISTLKKTLRPSFGMVLKYRLNVLCFYFAAVFLILFLLLSKEVMLGLSVGFIVLAMILILLKRINVKSPVQAADEEFYNALNNYEKYQRHIDTLYGDSLEAKTLLDNYAVEIDSYKKIRIKNRNLLAALFVGLMIIPVAIYLYMPTITQNYAEERDKYPEMYQMAELSKTLKYTPYPGCAENAFFRTENTAELKFDVLSLSRIFRSLSKAKYQMRIAGVNLLATGKTTTQPDTCSLQAALISKDGDIVGREFFPFEIIVNNNDDNYQTLFANGRGHIFVDFVSKDATPSAQRLKEIADSTYYFTIF